MNSKKFQQEDETFSKFGKAFQEKLAKIILLDRAFGNRMTEVLDVDYFELKYLQAFVSLVFEYKSEYKTHPTLDIMRSVVRTEMEDYPEVIQRQVREFVVRIDLEEETDEDDEYIKDKSLDFCRKQKLKDAILKSVSLLKKSSFEQITKLINDAMLLGADNDYGHDFIEDFEQRYMLHHRDPISTGWDEIDDIIRGGLGKKELGVIVAPTGAGKSMALVHLGTQAIKEGKTVIHYTLELADTVVGNRYDSCLTRVKLQDLHSVKDKIAEEVREIPGKLIIKEYPTKSASTNTIENHIERLVQRGIVPDMIIMDYADLLRPQQTNYRTELRHNLGDIYEELRGIAQKYGVPVWTASQTNRSGLNAEVITMESISEAFNKCFVADLICSISRTIEDKSQNQGRMFIAKNRNGPDGIVYPMTIDTSCVKMEVHHPDADAGGIDSVVAKTKQEQKDWLQKKYKSYSDGDKAPGNRRDKNSRAPTHRTLPDLLTNGPRTKEELEALPEWERRKFLRDMQRQRGKLIEEQANKTNKKGEQPE